MTLAPPPPPSPLFAAAPRIAAIFSLASLRSLPGILSGGKRARALIILSLRGATTAGSSPSVRGSVLIVGDDILGGQSLSPPPAENENERRDVDDDTASETVSAAAAAAAVVAAVTFVIAAPAPEETFAARACDR